MTNFEIAFKMFDLDGNGTLEPHEFTTIFNVLLKQSRFGVSSVAVICIRPCQQARRLVTCLLSGAKATALVVEPDSRWSFASGCQVAYKKRQGVRRISSRLMTRTSFAPSLVRYVPILV
jgi:hypothetical protein